MKLFNINIYNTNKNLASFLRQRFGINFYTSLKICQLCGISTQTLLKNLSLGQCKMLELRVIDLNLYSKSLVKTRRLSYLYSEQLGLLKLKRLKAGLPTRGQRTRSNANTVPKLRK